MTCTCGGASSGNWAIGSVGMTMTPARMITSEQTLARIGRLMKVSTNTLRTSGPSTLIEGHLAGASRLAALLLPQILPVLPPHRAENARWGPRRVVVAPCHPGAALGDVVLVQRGRATSLNGHAVGELLRS